MYVISSSSLQLQLPNNIIIVNQKCLSYFKNPSLFILFTSLSHSSDPNFAATHIQHFYILLISLIIITILLFLQWEPPGRKEVSLHTQATLFFFSFILVIYVYIDNRVVPVLKNFRGHYTHWDDILHYVITLPSYLPFLTMKTTFLTHICINTTCIFPSWADQALTNSNLHTCSN